MIILSRERSDREIWAMLITLSVLFSLLERMENGCTKIGDPAEMIAEFYTAPYFSCTKSYDPSPFEPAHPPSNE